MIRRYDKRNYHSVGIVVDGDEYLPLHLRFED